MNHLQYRDAIAATVISAVLACTAAAAQSTPATIQLGSVPAADQPAPTTVLPATSNTVDFSKVSGQSHPAPGAASLNASKVGGKLTLTSPAKVKKPPVATSGVWTWMTYNRSMQPEENTITLSTDKNGKVTGKLVDRLGEHEIKGVTVGDGTVSFDVVYHSRGLGNFAHTFTVSLDPDDLSVSVDRPDFSPLGKANGGKRHEQNKAKHHPAG